MPATVHSRQIRNRQLRDMGIRPTSSYQTLAEEYDLIEILVVNGESVQRFRGRVLDAQDHGWFRDVTCVVLDDKTRVTVRLWRDGPPDEGCIECRIVRKVAEVRRPNKGRR